MHVDHKGPLLVSNATSNIAGACSVSAAGLRRPPESWAPMGNAGAPSEERQHDKPDDCGQQRQRNQRPDEGTHIVPDAGPPDCHCRIPLRWEYNCNEQQPEDDEGHEREHEANHCGSLQRDSAAPIGATAPDHSIG
jgi:hypothetical protein